MTLVIARQFGDRIIVVSDTMISDPTQLRPNIIPGRLKSVVIDWAVSIAYAGLSIPGIEAVREAKRRFAQRRDLGEVLEFLKQETRPKAPDLEVCDFIVTSHLQGPAIYKIWNGTISSGQPVQWIGRRDAINLLRTETPRHEKPHGMAQGEFDEFCFMQTFEISGAALAAHEVGGFLVVQLGSPHGHCYVGHSKTTCFDIVSFPGGLTERQQADRQSGMTEYSYQLLGPLERGTAVVGAYLHQAQTLFTYEPLLRDDPLEQTQVTLHDAGERIKAVAVASGGIVSPVDL